MTKFNLLDHPICLSPPLFGHVSSEWTGYIPFAMFLISALRPRKLVEAGILNGVSYFAFCQAIKELKLNTRCYGTQARQKDLHNVTGNFDDLKVYHDTLYDQFSTLIWGESVKNALSIDNGTVDLLHLSGARGYETARQEFDTWLPKISERGVVLLDNINAREEGFEVWRLWENLRQEYPHFELMHGQGIGLLAIGKDSSSPLQEILALSEADRINLQEFFIRLGQHLKERLDDEQQIKALSNTITSQQETIAALTEELTAVETRLNTILNTRSWRWVNRLGRIKILYFEPVYEKLIWRLRKRPSKRETTGGSRELPEITEIPDPLAPKECWTDPVKTSLTLLPEPKPKQILRLFNDQPPPAPLHKPDVVCFSIIDWDYTYQRPQQLLSRFAAQGHRVFLIKLKNVLPQDSEPRFSLKEIKKNLYEVTLAAPRLPRISQEIINGYNAEAFLGSLDSLRRDCYIGDAIGYVMNPSWKVVALEARNQWGWQLIYDCMDEWEGFPGVLKPVTKGESELVRECDLLVVTAATLQKKWRKQRTAAAVLVRNGVDYDFYEKRCQPNALLYHDKRPLVGYYGAIADWFDLELMIYVAEQRPQYSFVLIGGVFDVDVSRLEALPNVRLLGQQPYETMPQYLYHFDACLIPFKLNAVTHATDPVKVYEYLSAGKPVVSTKLAELQSCDEYLYIAENREDFLVKLDRAVTEQDEKLKARRREFARSNTWQARYEAIVNALAETNPRASIIIVTYNNLALNKLCLESIVRNTEYLNYEVVVVDNNSSDGTPEFLREFAVRHQNIRYILNPANHGFAKANNQGIEISTGAKIVLLNNDTVVPSGWLSHLLKRLDDPQIGMVGPVTNYVANEAKIEVAYNTWSEMERFAIWRAQEYDGETADIFMLAMFCVAFRRKTYESIGPLDEQFGIGMFEDDDYSLRLKAAGYRIICATDVFVHHFGQSTFKNLVRTGEYNQLFYENRQRFEDKWKIKWLSHKNKPLIKNKEKK